MDSMSPKSDDCQIGLFTAAHMSCSSNMATSTRCSIGLGGGNILTALERILLKNDAMLADISRVVTPGMGARRELQLLKPKSRQRVSSRVRVADHLGL